MNDQTRQMRERAVEFQRPAAEMAINCPAWCVGSHAATVEHHSTRVPAGNVLVELVREPDQDHVVVSLLEPHDGGRYFQLRMSTVPLIAAAALRLTTAS